jgi:hypothetical protein
MTPLTSLWDLSLFFRELRCVNILVGWKMEVRQTFLAGPLMCVALRRQRSEVRILSGAPMISRLCAQNSKTADGPSYQIATYGERNKRLC